MSIYQSLYDLIVTYIFGGSVDVASVQELACTLFALGGSLFVLAIPFIVVLKVIKLIMGG